MEDPGEAALTLARHFQEGSDPEKALRYWSLAAERARALGGLVEEARHLEAALDALNQRDDVAEMRSKEQRFNPLGDTSPFEKTFIKTFNIVGLPILVILFGLFIWMRRHSRKKQIHMIFQ
jgi:ABC-type uncharacterized transport system involved in gliding motility auxiliary subunit